MPLVAQYYINAWIFAFLVSGISLMIKGYRKNDHDSMKLGLLSFFTCWFIGPIASILAPLVFSAWLSLVWIPSKFFKKNGSSKSK